MDSGEWIGVAAFVTGVIGTIFGAVYGARKNAASEEKEAAEVESGRVEHRLSREDRELAESFLRHGRHWLEEFSDFRKALVDYTDALHRQ